MTTRVIAMLIVIVIEEFGLEGGSDDQNYLSRASNLTLSKRLDQLKPPLNLPKVLFFGHFLLYISNSVVKRQRHKTRSQALKKIGGACKLLVSRNTRHCTCLEFLLLSF